MKRILVLIILAVSTLSAFTIKNFDEAKNGEFSYNQPGVFVDGGAKRITAYEDPKSDKLLLRIRRDITEYGLYIGKIIPTTFDNLTAFRVPNSKDFLYTKFFSKRNPGGIGDVSKIYFGDGFIYATNVTKIWYKKDYGSKWEFFETNSIGIKAGVLSINSTPIGATVTIDGVYKGKTPYSFKMDAPSVEVSVNLSGYYTRSFTAKVSDGEKKNKSVSLSKKLKVTASTNPLTLVNRDIDDIVEAENQLNIIKKAEKSAKSNESTLIENFENRYPALVPQDEFETTPEFRDRARKYRTKKSIERNNLMVNTSEFSRAISSMQSHINNLDNKEFSLYLPVNSLNLGRFNADINEFPVTINIKQGKFEFAFVGKLAIPRNVARKFKFSTAEKGLRVLYGKRLAVGYINKKKVSRYFKYGKLVLPFEGVDYELIGKVSLPRGISNSQSVKSYYAQRVERERVERVAKKTKGMKKIRGGSFMMGSYESDDEKPVHRVTVGGL